MSLVERLHTVSTGAHSIVVGVLWKTDKVLGAILAHCSAALATVVLSLQEAESCFADETAADFLTTP